MDTYANHGLRALVCGLALMAPVVALGQRQNFVRGDVDGSRVIDVSDPIGIFGYAFLGTFTPTCLKTADANDDGRIDIGDGIWLLAFSFRGSSPPPAPFPDCGVDPTADGLECTSFASCPVFITFGGRVVDIDGEAVRNATVEVGDLTISADASGGFAVTLESAAVGDSVIVRARAPGYSTSQRELVGIQGGSLDTSLTLLPVHAAVVDENPEDGIDVDVEVDGELDGRVSIPAGALSVGAPVRVEITLLDPSAKAAAATPGRNLVAAADPGEENGFSDRITLESFGMIEVRLTNTETGEAIHDLDAPAVIESRLPAVYAASSREGDTVPLWYFDEARNLWVEEGQGTVVRGDDGELWLRGEVVHFTWWNWDVFRSVASLHAHIDFPASWTIAPEFGVEGLSYAGRYTALLGTSASDVYLGVKRTETTVETSRLMVTFGGGEVYYLKESSPGILETTLEAGEAMVLESPTEEVFYGVEEPSSSNSTELGTFTLAVPGGLRPFASVSSPNQYVCLHGTAELVATANDGDGGPMSLEWFAPAGTLSSVAGNPEGMVFTPPSTPGAHTVILTATDDEGDQVTVVFEVYVLEACVEEPTTLRGDVDLDGRVQIADLISLLNFLGIEPSSGFDSCEDLQSTSPRGPVPPCMEAADWNGDGIVSCEDALGLKNYMFIGSETPASQRVNCGQ